MAGTTYSLKEIQVAIALDVGGANNSYSFQGFCTTANIEKSGGVDFATADVQIYGLSLDVMGRLTTLAFRPLNRRWNAISIAAGEQGTELSTIFQGEITVAFADLNGASPVMKIQAQTSAYNVLSPTPQIAVTGAQSVDQLMTTLCKDCEKTFVNEGVDASLSNTVLTGDPVGKMRQIADQIGADLLIDDSKVVLLPRGGTRTDTGVPVISADSGMIGYPTFTNTGVEVQTFFRPDLKIGGAFRLESIVPNASGIWKITRLAHELSAHNPNGGAWRTSVSGFWIEE